MDAFVLNFPTSVIDSTRGFLPFDWTKVPIQQVLSRFSKSNKAFVSRGSQARVSATEVYVFNFGTDTVWCMRRIAALLLTLVGVKVAEREQQLIKNAGC